MRELWRWLIVACAMGPIAPRAMAQDVPATRPAAPAAAAAGLNGPDPKIARIVAAVSEERVAAIMKRFGEFETRNTLSDPNQRDRGVGAAREWIFGQFKSYSPRLQVSFDTHQIPKGRRVWKPVELRNGVAVLPGTASAYLLPPPLRGATGD